MENVRILRNSYEPPQICDHQNIRFETAQSWNKGHGNQNHHGNGNGGTNYPNDPYTGPHNGNGGGKGRP
ncbi:hypothetical protein [Falsibacillus albus]|uniref:hypothetical protein n=1 Tax=Falsibacillus albus TaxID=2478915 RepID=UPI0011E5E473|nr:hypothetical protein [Falsibacillus albus]